MVGHILNAKKRQEKLANWTMKLTNSSLCLVKEGMEDQNYSIRNWRFDAKQKLMQKAKFSSSCTQDDFVISKYQAALFQVFDINELKMNCVARATLWFCPVFFFADIGLFLETGKGLTCAVFMESVELRPD